MARPVPLQLPPTIEGSDRHRRRLTGAVWQRYSSSDPSEDRRSPPWTAGETFTWWRPVLRPREGRGTAEVPGVQGAGFWRSGWRGLSRLRGSPLRVRPRPVVLAVRLRHPEAVLLEDHSRRRSGRRRVATVGPWRP